MKVSFTVVDVALHSRVKPDAGYWVVTLDMKLDLPNYIYQSGGSGWWWSHNELTQVVKVRGGNKCPYKVGQIYEGELGMEGMK